MKRFIVAVVASASIVVGSAAVAVAGRTGPEIGNANATIQLSPNKFVPKACVGQAGVPYVTYRGSWTGGETDLTPGSTNYNLTGSLTVHSVVWTVNQVTQRGVLRGQAELVSPSATGATGTVTYTGPITLITQGLSTVAGQVPSKRDRLSRVAWRARRVLPVPPGPVRVTSPGAAHRPLTMASSLGRAMKLVRSGGRFPRRLGEGAGRGAGVARLVRSRGRRSWRRTDASRATSSGDGLMPSSSARCSRSRW